MKELLSIIVLSCAGFMWGLRKAETPTPQLEWGLSDMQGRRLSMEDAFMHELIKFDSKKACPCFALFDGHGGPDASRDAALLLPKFLPLQINKRFVPSASFEEVLKDALCATCNEIDELLQKTYARQGTTALIALIADDKAHLAWVGDSRGVIFSDKGVIKCATQDHKPDSPSELERIGAENLTITSIIQDIDGQRWLKHRLFASPLSLNPGQTLVKNGPARLGGLSLSRALGDSHCKKSESLITAVPDLQVTPLSQGDHMILACDGLWDVISTEEAVTFVKELLRMPLEMLQKKYADTKPLQEVQGKEVGSSDKLCLIARALRDKAYELESSDNISVMLIKLRS